MLYLYSCMHACLAHIEFIYILEGNGNCLRRFPITSDALFYFTNMTNRTGRLMITPTTKKHFRKKNLTITKKRIRTLRYRL